MIVSAHDYLKMFANWTCALFVLNFECEREAKLGVMVLEDRKRLLRSSQNALSDSYIKKARKTPVFKRPLEVDQCFRSN